MPQQLEHMNLQDPSAMPPIEFVCERLGLMAGTLNLLVAAGCSGKTYLAQQIAQCVASGVDFLKAPVKQGKVIHVDQEMNGWIAQRRYYRIRKAMNVKPDNVFRTKVESRLDEGAKGQAEFDELLEMCRGSTLVIVDSLRGITIADENSSDVERPLRMLQLLAEKTGACVLVIHHKGKTTTSARQTGRGHSSIYDCATVQWDLDVSLRMGEKTYTLTNAKNRNGDDLPELSYKMVDTGKWVPEFRESEALVFEPINVKDATEELVLETIKKSGEINVRGLLKIVKEQARLYKAIETLKAENKIDEARGSRGSRVFTVKRWEDNSLLRRVI